MEICAAQLGSTGKQLIVICVYTASSANYNQFLKLLDMMQYLQSLYRPITDFLVCGDINVDYLTICYQTQQLSLLLGTYSMFHTANVPNNHALSTDNIFLDLSRLVLIWYYLHHMVYLMKNAQCVILNKSFVKTSTNLQN